MEITGGLVDENRHVLIQAKSTFTGAPSVVTFPMDLIFLSRDNRVVRMEEFVLSPHVFYLTASASSVLQLPPHTIYSSKTKLGDEFESFC